MVCGGKVGPTVRHAVDASLAAADGDVANGSFEERAPFGGYGWRYYTDDGVSRLENAAQAKDGAWYLRLEDGAEVHQPNPAEGGDTVEATLWLRGGTANATATVTIDFRNQGMYTSPIQSFPTTLSLTNTWQPYTVSAVAPTGTPLPVFHTRLTVRADASHVVYVDDIHTTTTP